MGWMQDLYETYEENTSQVGVISVDRSKNQAEYTLLPVSHVYQGAQIEVTLSAKGEFLNGVVLPKERASTLLPATADSANRTSGAVPHALHDKLMYVAGDFEAYGGVYKKATPHQDYLEQLKAWCQFDPSNQQIQAVYNYLSQGHLIRDLVAKGVLYADDGLLVPKWSKDYQALDIAKPDIFTVLAGDQLASFVRFTIVDEVEPWKDTQMYQSFIDFYSGQITETGLCYVTGKRGPLTDKHASKIRFGGDMAKLISSNNGTGRFTALGRLTNNQQVASIGYDTSQKSLNALKWLITKQGQTIDGRVFLAWGKKTVTTPDPYENILLELGVKPATNQKILSETHDYFAKQFNQAITGYQHQLKDDEEIIIMILDAATPGRMAVVYYQKLDAKLYLERIANWHHAMSWRHPYRRNEAKEMTFFIGAPTPRDIAQAVYGSHASDQTIKVTIESLLPCIVDGRRLPNHLIRQVVQRASKPQSMEKWEWLKTLSITCSLVQKFYNDQNQLEEEKITMALNSDNKNRSYLFGRLLAVLDYIEEAGLARDENRLTNAQRYMDAFSKNPVRTYEIINSKLMPYIGKMKKTNKGLYIKMETLLANIIDSFVEGDFNDKVLTGHYLNGYYSQRQEFYKKNNTKEEQK